jgi:hypothetical protein
MQTLRRIASVWLAVAVLCLAPSSCTISIGQAPAVDAKNAITVPVRIVQFHGATRITAQLTIKGQGPFGFVIDTGAEVSAIDADIAAQLGLPVVGQPHEVSGVGGTAEAVPVHIENWHLDKIKLPAGSIDSQTLGDLRNNDEVGLLGSDILSQFGTVTIDYASNTLTVYRQIA